jgi:hypothetical protein
MRPIGTEHWFFYVDFWRRCQSEFEKDYMEGLNKEKYQAQMVDPALSEADKKKLKVNNLNSTVKCSRPDP